MKRRSRPAPPHTKPIIRDIFGDEWSVFEHRKTPYGFPLILGRPYPPPSVQGGSGGTGVIMTAPLAAHLRANERTPYRKPLPVGHGSVIRLRALLGLDHLAWDDARIEWWMDRLDDLAFLPVPTFVAKHIGHAWTRSGKLSEALVWNMRVALIGRQRQVIGWWKAPAVQKLLTSTLPGPVVAKRLNISLARVGELRRKSRALHKRGRR